MENVLPESLTDLNTISVLIAGVETKDLTAIEETLAKCTVRYSTNDIRTLMGLKDLTPSIVLCSHNPEAVSSLELAQLLRQLYQDAIIFLISYSREQFDRKELMRNGFHDAFLLPLEKELLEKQFRTVISKLTLGLVPTYHPIKLLDLRSELVLSFDTYLLFPLNNRIVRFSNNGEALGEERIQKLKSHQVGTLYVATDQLSQFYSYSRELLATQKEGINPFKGITVRKEDLQARAREFMNKILNTSTEDIANDVRNTLNRELRNIIDEFVIRSKNTEWYLPLLNWTGEEYNVYGHAANVSLYSTLFASRLGLDHLDDIAIAGLLHDVGLGNIHNSDVNSSDYKRHIGFSVNFLKTRGFPLSERLFRLIQSHHERFDGSGYPMKRRGMAITLEAQLIGVIDEIDYRIAKKEGIPLTTPYQVLKEMQHDSRFNPGLIKRMLEFFPI